MIITDKYFANGKLNYFEPTMNNSWTFSNPDASKRKRNGTKIKQIYLHHTATWDANKSYVVPFQIDGFFRKDQIDNGQDGTIFKTYDYEKYYTLHLAVKSKATAGVWSNSSYLENKGGLEFLNLKESILTDYPNSSIEANKKFDKDTIGIEIINYGYVVKDGNQWKSRPKEDDDDPVQVLLPHLVHDENNKDLSHIIDYSDKNYSNELFYRNNTVFKRFNRKGYKNNKYFIKYSKKQVQATKKLLIYLSLQHDVPMINQGTKMFNMSKDALTKVPGIYTHTSVRIDKTDCHPQPSFIKMLNEINALGEVMKMLSAHRKSLVKAFPSEGYFIDIDDLAVALDIGEEELKGIIVDKYINFLFEYFMSVRKDDEVNNLSRTEFDFNLDYDLWNRTSDLEHFFTHFLLIYIKPEHYNEMVLFADKVLNLLLEARYYEYYTTMENAGNTLIID